MAKKAKTTTTVVKVEPTFKGTSIGRHPIISSMNKDKRRTYKKYRGQGRV